MLLTVPQYSQVISQVRARVQANRSTISTLPGSVTGDTMVVPQALSDTQQQALTYYAAIRQALLDLLALENDANTLALLAQALNTTPTAVLQDISASIDSYTANFNQYRKQPSPALGVVQFGSVDAPTTDITVGVGITVLATNGQQYTTTGSATMYAALAATYFNPNLQLYLISVPVIAVAPGSAGNAAANTVSSIITPVNGLPLVTNIGDFPIPATGAGQDLETDQAYVTRFLNIWQAVGIVTPGGITMTIQNNAVVGSVYLAPPGNAFNVRGYGATELYIQNQSISSYTETFSAYNHPTIANAILPTNRPLAQLVSVSTGTAILQLDTTSALVGSVQSLDAIRFTTTPTFPVTVTYTYNSMVADVQNIFSSTALTSLNYQAPTSTISAIETPLLVRQAPQVLVNYTVSITVLPGYIKSQVVTAVLAALQNYFSGLVLGVSSYVDDLNKVVEQTAGVLRLNGDPTTFSTVGGSGVLASIQPAANAIIVPNSINIF